MSRAPRAGRRRSPAAGAERFLREAAALAPDRPWYAGQLGYEAMRAGAPVTTVAAELERLAARCDARLVATYAAHAPALAARDGNALLAVADEMAAIGATAYAVEAAVAARAFLREARQDSARRAANRARRLHEPDQETEPPHVDGLDEAAVALTAREEQLVGLARQALANSEIAGRLVLSVRTVESHIYGAMQKLGVSDRRDL